MPLDPRTFAVRPDLADVRLAGRVFAPHYAGPLPCVASREAFVTALADGGDAVARLSRGDRFDLLDRAGGRAWGIAVDAGLVGYVDADALEAAE